MTFNHPACFFNQHNYNHPYSLKKVPPRKLDLTEMRMIRCTMGKPRRDRMKMKQSGGFPRDLQVEQKNGRRSPKRRGKEHVCENMRENGFGEEDTK